MMTNVLIPISHHRAPFVPSAKPDDMDLGGHKCIGISYDRADIHVVLPVLDRNVKAVPMLVEVIDNCRSRPLAESIYDIAAVTVNQ